MKRTTSMFLILAMIISALWFPDAAQAASSIKIWDGTEDTAWYTGDKNEYNISTAEQLAGLSKLVNSGCSMEGVTINVTKDIIMNDTSDWENWRVTAPKNQFTPIGATGNPVGGYYPFCGAFNGNGHSIKGLYINNPRAAGLFGYLYCAGVTSVIITESVIIGYDNKKGTGVYAGGIAGIIEGSVINQCRMGGEVYADGQLDSANGWRTANAGGIAGAMQTENVTSLVFGMALAAGGVVVNPILFNDGSGGLIKDSGIFNCVVDGRVETQCGIESFLGGILGYGNNGVVRNCLFYGPYHARRGKYDLGALYCGGIMGHTDNCFMYNCYYFNDTGTGRAIGQNWSAPINGVVKEENATSVTTGDFSKGGLAKKISTSFVDIYYKEDSCVPELVCDLSKKDLPKTAKEAAKRARPKAKVSGSKATLTWGSITNADKYVVYIKQGNGKYKAYKSTTEKTMVLKNLEYGKTYNVMVKVKFKDGTTSKPKGWDLSFKTQSR